MSTLLRPDSSIGASTGKEAHWVEPVRAFFDILFYSYNCQGCKTLPGSCTRFLACLILLVQSSALKKRPRHLYDFFWQCHFTRTAQIAWKRLPYWQPWFLLSFTVTFRCCYAEQT